MTGKRSRMKNRQNSTELDYRIPMQITEINVHWNGNGYYVCPRCHVSMEREFISYCDRCGQCLNWSQYKKAKHVYGKG